MTDMNEYEYDFLTDNWTHGPGACFNATGEFCYEFGWIDQFGLVTPQGRTAIEQYERLKANGVKDKMP